MVEYGIADQDHQQPPRKSITLALVSVRVDPVTKEKTPTDTPVLRVENVTAAYSPDGISDLLQEDHVTSTPGRHGGGRGIPPRVVDTWRRVINGLCCQATGRSPLTDAKLAVPGPTPHRNLARCRDNQMARHRDEPAVRPWAPSIAAAEFYFG